MIVHRYKCTLHEPLILFKKAKTEQTTETLDYLPGSLFRGIIAGSLFFCKSDNQLIDDIVFNGAVLFGDANIMINGSKSLKIPASFYTDSQRVGRFENFHLISNYSIKRKQAREGYVIENGKDDVILKNVALGERLKAARSTTYRSSENGAIYFYRFIDAGQSFCFDVKSDSKAYLNLIREKLEEKSHYLGKSKSAEFGGKATIELIDDRQQNNTSINGKYIYAESNLCFLNEFGEFSAWPTAYQLTGDTTAKINWMASQVRYRTYAPYNSHRQAYDAERLIIEKGSVFVLENEIEFSDTFLAKPIGCFATEGFGEIMINPTFLMNQIVNVESRLDEEIIANNFEDVEKANENNSLIKFINKKYDSIQIAAQIDAKTDEWLAGKSLFSKISKAQWGAFYNAVRNVSTNTDLENTLFGNDHGICEAGKNNKWTAKDKEKIKEWLKIYDAERITAIRSFAKKKIADTK